MSRHLIPTVLFLLASFPAVAAAAPAAPENIQAHVNGRTVTLTWQAPTQVSAEEIGRILACVLNPGTCQYMSRLALSTNH